MWTKWLGLILMCLICPVLMVGCNQQEPTKENIAGKWEYHPRDGFVSVWTLHADGTYEKENTATKELAGMDATVHEKGIWEVKDGALWMRVTATDRVQGWREIKHAEPLVYGIERVSTSSMSLHMKSQIPPYRDEPSIELRRID